MAFTLPQLPYAKNALEPHVSAATLELHHGKHHKTYVDKLNELLQGNPLASSSLEDIVRAASGPAPATSASTLAPTPGTSCR